MNTINVHPIALQLSFVKKISNSISTTENRDSFEINLGADGRHFILEISSAETEKTFKRIFIEINSDEENTFSNIDDNEPSCVVNNAAHFIALVKLFETVLKAHISTMIPFDDNGDDIYELRNTLMEIQ